MFERCQKHETAFVEVPLPSSVATTCKDPDQTAAVICGKNGITLEIQFCASEAFIKNLIGALAYAE